MNGGLEQTADQMDVKLCADTIRKYPDVIVGVKTAHYWTDEPGTRRMRFGPRSIAPKNAAPVGQCSGDVRFLAAAGKNLCRPDSEENAAGRHSHSCVRPAISYLLAGGKLNPILAEARARGVIFDVGHGRGSFWFRNAVPAVKQGFIPDSISTDLHMENFTVSEHDAGDVQVPGDGGSAE